MTRRQTRRTQPNDGGLGPGARRWAPLIAALLAVVAVSACSTGGQASVETVVQTVVSGAPDSSGGTASATQGSSAGSDQSAPPATTTGTPSPTPEPEPVAEVSAEPAFGTKGLSPAAPIEVKVSDGTIEDLTMTNPEGKVVKGEISEGGSTWKLGEVLGYDKSYTVTGSAVGSDGKSVAIKGSYSTVKPTTSVRTTISPGDGKVVGVAAPVIVTFGVEPTDRAAIEKLVSITTEPEVEGAWAWIQHDGGDWGLDYRPKEYWPSGTKVHVEAKVYGFEFAKGAYGVEDLSSDFTIGRNQVVVADVNSHELVVEQDGIVVATYPASYGRGTDADTTTRSGIHVVNEKFDKKLMSNPKYGYVNVLERFAVRISNNGEFIHANPDTVGAQGSTNVSHGCVNLSLADAEAYYESAIYGDPVEVTGTAIQLEASDGDVFDWAVPWDVWVTLSGKNS